MNKSKTKKNIKVRDLKPKKDAKGGGGAKDFGSPGLSGGGKGGGFSGADTGFSGASMGNH